MKITLCIPVYNEAAILPETLATLSAYMKERFLSDYEVLFINDGSTDGSADLIAAFQDPAFRLVGEAENHGKGYAVRKGVLAARGEIILFTDCDLAYGTDVIGDYYDRFAALPEADLLIGSRVKHPEGYAGYSLLRKIVSRAYIRVLKLLAGLRVSDSQCGCKGFRSEAGRRIFSHCEVDRFAFDLEVILVAERLGARIVEVPVRVLHHGDSKVHLVKDTLRMLRDLRKIKKRVRTLPAEKSE